MAKLLQPGCDNGLFKIKVDKRTLWGYTRDEPSAISLGDTPEQGIGDDRSDLWFVKRKPDGESYEGLHVIIGLGPNPTYFITYYQEWSQSPRWFYSFFRLEKDESKAQVFLNNKDKLITADRDNQTLHAKNDMSGREHLLELDAYKNTSWNVELQGMNLCPFAQDSCPNRGKHNRDPSVAEFTLVTGCPPSSTPSTPSSDVNSSKNSNAPATAVDPASSSKKSSIPTLLMILGGIAGFFVIMIILIIIIAAVA